MLKKINKKRNKKGFTLVELVVVIAILGILAAIAVPKLSASRENASIAAHNANVRTLESAATLAVSEGLTFGDNGKNDITWEKGTNEEQWKEYLQSWPDVPTGVKGNKYNVVTGDDDTVTSSLTIADNYTVTIKPNGDIKVESGRIIK